MFYEKARTEVLVTKQSAIVKEPFGRADGQDVSLYTLSNANGLVMKVTSYGAIVTHFHAPDRSGKMADIVAGYDTLAEYVKSSPYFGAIAGRVANRIRNSEFALEGKAYKLADNDAPHHLHGGKKAFDKVVWAVETSETPTGRPSD